MTHNSMGDMKKKTIYYFGQKNALKIQINSDTTFVCELWSIRPVFLKLILYLYFVER